MTWLLTNTGREHSLLAMPHPDNTPTSGEIAWSLAHINRYTGHARRAYSVAEHSLLVADIAYVQGAGCLTQMLCLMHDAHECIVGDVSSPVKHMLGATWAAFEAFHQHALLQAYDLDEDMDDRKEFVKHCDLIALATERPDLTHFDASINTPWPVIDTPGNLIAPLHAPGMLMVLSRTLITPSEWAEEFERSMDTLLAAVHFNHPRATA